MSKKEFSIPDGCDFDQIDHKYSSNVCSPQILNPEYEGLLINVNRKIALQDDMEVLLASSYAFNLRTDLGLFGNVRNEIVFTVVDGQTHKPYSGKVSGIENPVSANRRPNDPTVNVKKVVEDEEKPDQYYGGYVNLDLIEVTGMPKKVGRYIVYATVSSFQSNVVEIEVVKPK